MREYYEIAYEFREELKKMGISYTERNKTKYIIDSNNGEIPVETLENLKKVVEYSKEFYSKIGEDYSQYGEYNALIQTVADKKDFENNKDFIVFYRPGRTSIPQEDRISLKEFLNI